MNYTIQVRLHTRLRVMCVDVALGNFDQLIRPFKKVKSIGHAAGLGIIWPSIFVCCSSYKFYCCTYLIFSLL